MKAKRALDPVRFSPEKRWPYSDEKKTKEAGGNLHALESNYVFINWLPGWTPRQIIEAIASHAAPPIPLDSLDRCFDLICMLHGGRIEGYAADRINEIVSNYQGHLRWWMSKKGLVIAAVDGKIERLSPFDRRAGTLMMEHFIDGKLSKERLVIIAKTLDKARMTLEGNLQPAHWQQIKENNQNPKRFSFFSPVETFSQAVRNKKFARFVRIRLYYARDRYVRSMRHD